ncbi:hypothetical protein DSO57_1017361 [Entomophthora muscae]|uniref:Uncharacterized protein n=1 Tax=Entomophthora muscae TaxID=34485 RepID=A0ACC2T5G3_9FUNG|nr:hypothetical protein DSO57_1017361 [Entomophthora muscae]
MVDVYFSAMLLCSGVHVRDGVVLTSALLVEKAPELMTVHINASRTLEGRALWPGHRVLGVAFHPKFKRSIASKYNVALLGLATPVKPFQRVVLDGKGLWKYLPQSGLRLVGWGWELGEWDDVEKFYSLPVWQLPLDECRKRHHKPIDSSHEFCVDDGQGNAKASLMSSGSAVLFQEKDTFKLVGIMSWSSYNGFSDYTPPVMLGISAVARWIEETIE